MVRAAALPAAAALRPKGSATVEHVFWSHLMETLPWR